MILQFSVESCLSESFNILSEDWVENICSKPALIWLRPSLTYCCKYDVPQGALGFAPPQYYIVEQYLIPHSRGHQNWTHSYIPLKAQPKL